MSSEDAGDADDAVGGATLDDAGETATGEDNASEAATVEGHENTDHVNSNQDVIAVEPDDVEQGTVNRLDAHTGEGIRHRAFTCLVSDTDGRILLAQRVVPDYTAAFVHKHGLDVVVEDGESRVVHE